MQHLIANYGLLAVWALMAAESACIPVPSEVTMLFAGALAAGAIAMVVFGAIGVSVSSAIRRGRQLKKP